MKQPLWTKSFLNVCTSNFFIFLVFYILFVTMPIFSIEQLQVPESRAGLVVTVFLLSAIIIRPLSGHWVDAIGRMPMLITAVTIFFVSSGFYFFAESFGWLLLIRFIQGIGFGMGTTVMGALAADVVPDSRKGEGMGYFAMSMNLAMVAGPFVGLTLIQSYTYTTLFAVCTLFAGLAFATGLFIRVPKLPEADRPQSLMPGVNGLLEKSVLPVALTGAFIALAYSSVLSFVSVHAKNIGLEEAASYFFVVYAVVLLLSRPFTGKWFDQYGENIIVIPAIFIFSIGMYLLGSAQTAFVLLAAGGLIGLGYGTLVPSMQTIALQKVPKRAGAATATFFTIFDIGIGSGSFLVGIVAESVGFRSLYVNSSIFIVLIVGVYILLHGRFQRGKHKKSVQSRVV
ncbi:MFS transporter [Salimicrobium salexigens]|uniref:Predicted arabinose efflux permease, MFS family n=1 Tax=Salimicrobium salexigens TaxID=908941 RepID=A0ABY1KUI4_9BACI|nr:MFS transporter [Salimicrobium salexigens]SIS80825.1 Predicted arabinose efflux permease, MFS family [Salimicrobium salexigens]